MGFKLAVLALRVLEVSFFAGLAGCVIVVILSWISVAKDSFKQEE